MRLLTIFSLLILLTASCSKEPPAVPSSLAGTWQLVEIKDKSTGTTLTYPAGNSKKIILSIKEDGSFTGNTLRNMIEGGVYTLPASNEVDFVSFSMTKVAEDNLGSAFLTVLTSCSLQSVYPCKASQFTINRKTLMIKTALRYDLEMAKL